MIISSKFIFLYLKGQYRAMLCFKLLIFKQIFSYFLSLDNFSIHYPWSYNTLFEIVSLKKSKKIIKSKMTQPNIFEQFQKKFEKIGVLKTKQKNKNYHKLRDIKNYGTSLTLHESCPKK